MRMVQVKNTKCIHTNPECCFHGKCTVLRVLQLGTLVIENESGYIRLIEPEMVNEVEN
tara:strand:- start:522 stop:695 length:174 start_codon:yes stop_codon:yes gene_type:complete